MTEKANFADGFQIPTTFGELDELRDAMEIKRQFSFMADDFLHLASNVLHSPDVSDKSGAIAELSQELTGRLASIGVNGSESKSIELKAKWTRAFINDLPDSAFLYIETGGKKDADGKTTPRSLRHFPVKDSTGNPDVPHLRNAIAQASKAKDKDGAMLSDEIVSRVQNKARKMLAAAQKEIGFWKSVVQKAKQFAGVDNEPLAKSDQSFFVWKDKTTNEFWWLAVYSNNYRDDDNPPEIISSDAHKEFERAVDDGIWPMPELWLWHIPGTRCGECKMIAYDDETGFSIAAGTFDQGLDFLAERIKQRTDVLVSHGMPAAFIERDSNDPTVITRYRTREISPLPEIAAANKSTGFLILE